MSAFAGLAPQPEATSTKPASSHQRERHAPPHCGSRLIATPPLPLALLVAAARRRVEVPLDGELPGRLVEPGDDGPLARVELEADRPAPFRVADREGHLAVPLALAGAVQRPGLADAANLARGRRNGLDRVLGVVRLCLEVLGRAAQHFYVDVGAGRSRAPHACKKHQGGRQRPTSVRAAAGPVPSRRQPPFSRWREDSLTTRGGGAAGATPRIVAPGSVLQ